MLVLFNLNCDTNSNRMCDSWEGKRVDICVGDDVLGIYVGGCVGGSLGMGDRKLTYACFQKLMYIFLGKGTR